MILDVLKKFEGFSATPYYCAGGYKTIGYGHKIRPGENFGPLSQEQAEILLQKDIKKIEASVDRLIQVALTDLQKTALISFTFNVGAGALQRSTLRAKVNRAEHETVPAELLKWVYNNGKALKGLVYRRGIEGNLYHNKIEFFRIFQDS